MPQWLWILSLQQLATTAASIRVVLHHLIHPLDRQQLRPGSWRARLSATIAATAFPPLWRLKPRAIAGGRFGGVTGAAADPLPQAGQFGGQGSELRAELRDLLMLLLALLGQLRNPARTPTGVAAQSASEIPGGGVPIANSLCLRCKQESERCQGFSRDGVRRVLSRPLNAYELLIG